MKQKQPKFQYLYTSEDDKGYTRIASAARMRNIPTLESKKHKVVLTADRVHAGSYEGIRLYKIVPEYDQDIENYRRIAAYIRSKRFDNLKTLTDKERYVLKCQFAKGDAKKTLFQISREYCVTKQRIRQLKVQGLRKVKLQLGIEEE